MKKIIFATNNRHKLDEVSQILAGKVEILSLEDIGCHDDIPETADTLDGNALLKAQFVKEKFGYDCFADDTGLEIESLGNEPGVYSARYAGKQRNANDNMEKVLFNLSGKTNRKAKFRTVIALIEGDKELLFEGKVLGEITLEKSGVTGFGYDPIFRPDGYTHTFAELGNETKNRISHRAKAVEKLIEYLQNRGE